MATHIGMNGIKKLVECCVGINGVRRNVKEIYAGQNGTSKLVWMEKAPPGQKIFTSSQTWTVPSGVTSVDVFLVGAGGAGGNSINNLSYDQVGCGGGGGYTKTYKKISVTPNQAISVIVGAGGIGAYMPNKIDGNLIGNSGGISSFINSSYSYSAQGGTGGGTLYSRSEGVANGGSGGGAGYCSQVSSSKKTGGKGGSDGSNGYDSRNTPSDAQTLISGTSYGNGQGSTTRAFGESTATLYASGGSAASYMLPYKYNEPGVNSGGAGGNFHYTSSSGTINATNATSATANTGSGGGGAAYTTTSIVSNKPSGNGGSGIVIVRWGY